MQGIHCSVQRPGQKNAYLRHRGCAEGRARVLGDSAFENVDWGPLSVFGALSCFRSGFTMRSSPFENARSLTD